MGDRTVIHGNFSTRRRIAIVHEWISARAGSEQVFESLAAIIPDADLFALSRRPGVELRTEGRPITTTFLDHRVVRDHRGLTLPLMPIAWRCLSHRRTYDVVLTSHHSFAQANQLARKDGLHLCYVHSPARYIWSPEIDARGASYYLGGAKKLLRASDLRSTRRVHGYAANSTAVRARIAKYWNRDSTVIHPPVRVNWFGGGSRTSGPRNYVLAVGRWIKYKRFDLAIDAAAMSRIPLIVAGSGPEGPALRARADRLGSPVEFVENPTSSKLRELYRSALALIFPTVEDFGIVPVEAQAAGTPAIAPRAGGCLDTIIDNVTGLLLDELTVESICEAIDLVSRMEWDTFATHVDQFSEPAFHLKVMRWLAEAGDQ